MKFKLLLIFGFLLNLNSSYSCQIKNHNPGLMEYANMFYQAEQYDKAKEYYEMILKKDNNLHHKAYCNFRLGVIYCKSKNYEQSIPYLNAAENQDVEPNIKELAIILLDKINEYLSEAKILKQIISKDSSTERKL